MLQAIPFRADVRSDSRSSLLDASRCPACGTATCSSSAGQVWVESCTRPAGILEPTCPSFGISSPGAGSIRVCFFRFCRALGGQGRRGLRIWNAIRIQGSCRKEFIFGFPSAVTGTIDSSNSANLHRSHILICMWDIPRATSPGHAWGVLARRTCRA